MVNFDPLNLTSATGTQVNSANDSGSIYSYTTPAAPASGSTYLPMMGYSLSGGQSWGQLVYETTITGQNTRFGTSVQVGVGIGYGPVEITTMSR